MLGSPYINNCDYDGAGAALNQIYGKLSAPVSSAPQGNVSYIGLSNDSFSHLKYSLRSSLSIKPSTPPRVGPLVPCPSLLKATLTFLLAVKTVLLASFTSLITVVAKLPLVRTNMAL
jgi:hypothetical protein